MFSPRSYWRQPLGPNVPIDPDSAQYVAKVNANRATYGPNIQTTNWTHPLFIAGPDTPLQAMTLDRAPGTDPQLEAAFSAVPIPPEARPSGPWNVDFGDNHVAIYQPSTDRYWAAWKARQFEVDGPHTSATSFGQSDGAINVNAPGWHFLYGVAVQNASQWLGIFDGNTWPGVAAAKKWGASGLSQGGDIKASEAHALHIPHALFCACVNLHQTKYRWPALNTDGPSTEPFAPQMGMCFTLPDDYDVDAATEYPLGRAILRAIRDYGMYIGDSAGSAIALYCEPRSTKRGSQGYSADPWGGDVYGEAPGTFFGITPFLYAQEFPWEDLQVVDASHRPAAYAPGIAY